MPGSTLPAGSPPDKACTGVPAPPFVVAEAAVEASGAAAAASGLAANSLASAAVVLWCGCSSVEKPYSSILPADRKALYSSSVTPS